MMTFSIKVITVCLNFMFLINVSSQSKCTTCKTMVEKFEEGLGKTAKSNFGGGNTRWEEKSLGSYVFSETRLLEILESVCSSTECHTMLEEHEETIENWWFKHFAKKKDTALHNYLCVERLDKGCCLKGRYGSTCKECPGGMDNPCKGAGTCNGDGTREGTGTCSCDTGYEGDMCDKCTEGYLEESRTETNTKCTACHVSCEGGCTELGPQGCNDCKPGWEETDDSGCEDVNECESEKGNPCPDHQFCTNTEGSFDCTNCNIGCKGCTAPGPENCKECADRYYKDGDNCKACHISCMNSCTGSGADKCDACKEGWVVNENQICSDVNECKSEQCEDDKFCVNTPGSYRCNNCHSTCNGCTGSGIKNCKECKTGYKKDDNGACVDEDECAMDNICGENEDCVNKEGSYKCDCKKGYILKGGQCVKKVEAQKGNKKSSKSSSSGKSNKRSREQLSMDALQYFIALFFFVGVGYLLRRSVVAQTVFVFVFYLYILYFSMRFDTPYSKKSGTRKDL